MPVFDPADPNAPEFVAAMRSLAPDLFLAVGYMLRLGSEILAVPRIVSANVHASLLPAYRGRSPVFWALRHGERCTGLTIHAMDDRLDTGDLLYQVRVRTRRNDTVASLYDRIIAKGLSLVPRLIADARARLPAAKGPAGRGRLLFFRGQRGRFPHRLVPARRDGETLDYDHAGQVLRHDPRRTRLPLGRESRRRCPAGNARRPARCSAIAPAGCTIATGQGAVRLGADSIGFRAGTAAVGLLPADRSGRRAIAPGRIDRYEKPAPTEAQ